MLLSSNKRSCCLFVPIKTGVYLITTIGLLNKLSGFYGLISLEYGDPFAVLAHVYSLIALFIFSLGLYGINNNHHTLIRSYAIFYWIDFVIGSLMTVYFAFQWFIFTDHSLPEIADDVDKTRQHDDIFKTESIVSITILCVIRMVQIYFACIITEYYLSLNKIKYSKITAVVDEEMSMTETKQEVA
ncbi:hypothetical protein CU097_010399 [Rhizopus azygosporus]|uniref:Uncharacterized protein n=1 Tax=Rhizopus azygosporus TaxID=86630 RepID=A0A367JQP6_RHIAZ|nr:hypothetical protein CU097_010399 [Rhizopus azygosporus]